MKSRLMSMGVLFTLASAQVVATVLVTVYTLLAGAAGLDWSYATLLKVAITGFGSGAFFGIWTSAVVWHYFFREKD